MSRIARTLLFLLVPLVTATAARAATLYWTEFATDATGGIFRVDLDTLDVEPVIPTGLISPCRIAIDRDGGKIYWTSTYAGTIQRANLDGFELETIVYTGCTPLGIAVDGAGGKVYWSGGANVYWSNLDGSGAELLFSADEPGFAQDLALDLLNEKIYFSNWSAAPGSYGRLQRANLDGSDVEDVRPEIRNGPIGIAVDPIGGKVYYTKNPEAAGVGRVMRADLDGANPETVLSEVDPDSLALDLQSGKVYWTEPDFDNDTGTINRANLDGSDVELLPIEGIFPAGIAILSDAEPTCPGDLDGDNDVDLADLAELLGGYGITEGATYEDGDLDGDGDVDLADLADLLGLYGTTCT